MKIYDVPRGKKKERKGKERKGKKRKGKERKGKERKEKERKGKERKEKKGGRQGRGTEVGEKLGSVREKRGDSLVKDDVEKW